MKNYIILSLILTISSLTMFGWSHISRSQPDTMPLIPMMRLLLDDMKTVDEGIYTQNYALIKKGAAGIADHPKMTAADKKIIKETLGEEMKRFVKYDMTVHHHADSMRAAAIENDMKEVLRHYRIVQQGCVDCHSAFREPVSKARDKAKSN